MQDGGLGFIRHQIQRLAAARLECPFNDGEREKYDELLRKERELLRERELFERLA